MYLAGKHLEQFIVCMHLQMEKIIAYWELFFLARYRVDKKYIRLRR